MKHAIRRRSSALLAALCLFALGACAQRLALVDPHPQDAFLGRIAAYEGQAFEGRIVANEPLLAEDPFTDLRLVMHVREAGRGRLEIPFHVGDDRSRTWILTRTADGLRLVHDHRHTDGSDDELTRYGGDTRSLGTPLRQEFPADERSKELFRRHDLHVSVTNVWALEIDPGQYFAYELARPGRLFRVEFDLTRPVEPPRLRRRGPLDARRLTDGPRAARAGVDRPARLGSGSRPPVGGHDPRDRELRSGDRRRAAPARSA